VAPAQSEAELPVFNRGAFMQRMMDDEQLAHMIIETFLGDMPAQIKQLKSHVLARETQRIGQQAHKIKGASGNVGGEALSASAAALEQAAKTGDPSQIAARTAELAAQLEALTEALKSELVPHN
jgi:HPt (histidine-containing phosphotransfer) domain-containing protein